eukprot:3936779-Rhodomonas_salina.1
MTWKDLISAARLPTDAQAPNVLRLTFDPMHAVKYRTSGAYDKDWNEMKERSFAQVSFAGHPERVMRVNSVVARAFFGMDPDNMAKDVNFRPNCKILGDNFWNREFHGFPLLQCMQYFAKTMITKAQAKALLFGVDLSRQIPDPTQRNELFHVLQGSLLMDGKTTDDFTNDDDYYYGAYLVMELARELQVNSARRNIIDRHVKSGKLKELYNILLRGDSYYDDADIPDGFADKVDESIEAAFGRGVRASGPVWEGVDSYKVFLWVMFMRFFVKNPVDLDDELDDFHADKYLETYGSFFMYAASPVDDPNTKKQEIVILRPNIEHNMLGVIMGRGGLDDLGGTLWGQTQLECYSDSMHWLWGMSYKYNERALVWNEKNLVRLWDVCYGGYNGGKDCTLVDWTLDGAETWRQHTHATNEPYQGPSMAVMSFDVSDEDLDWKRNWPSPITFHQAKGRLPVDAENLGFFDADQVFMLDTSTYQKRYHEYRALMPDFTDLHLCTKTAGECVQENTASVHSAL